MIMMKFFRAISLVIWFRFGGTNQRAESGLENGALTSINRGLGFHHTHIKSMTVRTKSEMVFET
jgi:hypothetical protein